MAIVKIIGLSVADYKGMTNLFFIVLSLFSAINLLALDEPATFLEEAIVYQPFKNEQPKVYPNPTFDPVTAGTDEQLAAQMKAGGEKVMTDTYAKKKEVQEKLQKQTDKLAELEQEIKKLAIDVENPFLTPEKKQEIRDELNKKTIEKKDLNERIEGSKKVLTALDQRAAMAKYKMEQQAESLKKSVTKNETEGVKGMSAGNAKSTTATGSEVPASANAEKPLVDSAGNPVRNGTTEHQFFNTNTGDELHAPSGDPSKGVYLKDAEGNLKTYVPEGGGAHQEFTGYSKLSNGETIAHYGSEAVPVELRDGEYYLKNNSSSPVPKEVLNAPTISRASIPENPGSSPNLTRPPRQQRAATLPFEPVDLNSAPPTSSATSSATARTTNIQMSPNALQNLQNSLNPPQNRPGYITLTPWNPAPARPANNITIVPPSFPNFIDP